MQLFKSRKKKSWRKFRQNSRDIQLIRYICCGMLVLELAFFVRESMEDGLFKVSRGAEVSVEDEIPDGGKSSYEKISGFRIRVQDGQIDFYRREEFKSTN